MGSNLDHNGLIIEPPNLTYIPITQMFLAYTVYIEFGTYFSIAYITLRIEFSVRQLPVSRQ